MSIRARFYLVVMLSILFGVSTTSYLNYSIFKKETVKTFITREENVIKSVSNEMNSLFFRLLYVADLIRTDKNTVNLLEFGTDDYLMSLKDLFRSAQSLLTIAANISVVSMDGTVKAYSIRRDNISEEDYFVKAKSSYFVTAFTPNLDYPFSRNFVMATQVRSNNIPIGVVVITVDVQDVLGREAKTEYHSMNPFDRPSLQDVLKKVIEEKYGLSPGDVLMIIDDNGELVLSVGGEGQNYEQSLNSGVLSKITQMQSGYIEEEEHILFLAEISRINVRAVIRCPKSSMYEPVNYMRVINIGLHAATLILALICTNLLTRAVLPRLQKGVIFAEAVVAGKISGHLDEGNDELGVMFRAFNFMVTHFDRLVKERSAEQNRQLQEILDSSPTAMLITRSGVVRQVNNNGLALLDLDVGDSSRKMYADEEEYAVSTYTIELGGEVRNWNMKMYAADGGQLDALITMYPFVYEGEPSLLTWITDVTELTRARIMAEAASQAKTTFLSRMSHEMRTPLNAIIGLSEIELRNDLNGKTLDNLSKIHGSGALLLGIINDILDVSKIESGKFQIIPAKYDFANLVSDAIHQNVVRIAEKPITFEPKIDENIPVQLYGDELRIRQILNNLLSNAFKYTDDGKVTLTVRYVKLGNAARMEYVVSDTGRGIKKEDLAKLFSEYSQFDTWANRKIEGTGLGLSICKSLVELMGGSIEVESEYGKGSSFKVVIDQSIVDPTPIGIETAQNLRTFQLVKNSAEQKLVRRRIPHGKVLIVDDIFTNLDVAKGLMEPYELTIHCASSGTQAIEIISEAKTRYDVIFMDHMMPGVDGIEAVRVIREEIGTEYAKSIPIVVLTANALVGNEGIFLNSGFQDFLSKPIDVFKLNEVINKWIPVSPEEQPPVQETRSVGIDFIGGRSAAEWADLGLDVMEGAQRYGLDAYLQIIHSYVTHTPVILDKLRNVSEETLPDYAVTIHGIKGSTFGISANKIGKLAESLESAAKNRDFAAVARGNDTFLKEAEELLKVLPLLGKIPDKKSNAKERRAATDTGALRELLNACSKYDLTVMESAMSKLENFTYDEQPELVEWLREQLENLEYDSMRERLKEVLKNNV